MYHRPISKALSGLLMFLGGYLLLAIISSYLFANIGGFFNIIISPGLFFKKVFWGMSFYIPLYIFMCAFILRKQAVRKDHVFVLNMSLVVFLTLSLFFRLLLYRESSPFIDSFIYAFGRKSGSFFVFLLSIFEVILIYNLKLHLFKINRNIEAKEESDSMLFEDKKKIFADLNNEETDDSEESVQNENEDKTILIEPETDYSEYETLYEEVDDEIQPEIQVVEEKAAPSYVSPVALPEPEVNSIAVPEEDMEDAEVLEEDEYDDAEMLEEIPGGNTVYAEYSLVEEAEKLEDKAETAVAVQEAPVKVHEKKAPVPVKKCKYSVPAEGILEEYDDGSYRTIDAETKISAEVLKTTLEEFKIQAEVTGIKKGPVITMFEILPAPGVKLSKIVNLADNIALRLAASRLRIVAPIPGKHAVGIEVPNKKRAKVSFKEIIEEDEFRGGKKNIPIVLGKDITGGSQIIDLTQTPHLLIAGATGSGKSVCVNSIISSILYKRTPEEVKMILIDPKIVELKLYNDIPHLLTPVITESKKAFQALQYCLYEMERRYSLLDALGVRDIKSYNKKIKVKKMATLPLPYIVIIVDEFADLMATSGKELESTLARLAAMSRAVGIHLVLATQRPSIDVITGLIKANIPSRIAFMVASKFDSRIILDSVGAEKLLGQGDMLFTSAWNPFPSRIQGAYLSEEEVEKIADFVRTLGEPEYIDEEIFIDDDEDDQFNLFAGDSGDPLFEKAIEIISSTGKASASYLQRRLKIGYNRAARMIEELEERGIVGPQNGSKPREVLHIPDKFKE